MSNTKLFYSYKDTNNTGKVTLNALSSYSDSIIFDENNRRIWHNGKQYGNTYWGTKHGETFNDLENNYAYNYAHAEGKNSYAGGECSHAEGLNNYAYSYGSHVEGSDNKVFKEANYSHVEGINNFTYSYGSHVEGSKNKIFKDASYSHVEGENNFTYSYISHVEGSKNKIFKDANYSHVEGENNIAYGKGSHAEGLNNTSIGYYSHTEGENSYAYGKCSHTQGLGTVAYNNYEAAFGQYNKSINGGNNPTIYSIGDGNSYTQRHNIIEFRKNGDMYKNGNSYFHDNIYGPVSHTYVSSLGETATLNIVLSSLLEPAKYTKPSYALKFLDGENGPEYGKVDATITDTGNVIEVGSTINLWVDLELYDYNENDNTYGMSYGLSYCSFSHNNVNHRYTSLGKHDLNISYTFIDEGSHSMTDGQPISLCYQESSYAYYPQLLKKEVYVISGENWFGAGSFNIGDYKIFAKYRYYCGFSNTLPENKSDLQNGNSGLLNNTTYSNGTTISCVVGDGYGKTYFWIAFPSMYFIDENFKILLEQEDGSIFELISDDKKMNFKKLEIYLGDSTLTNIYTIAYIEFGSTIGNKNSVVSFIILPVKTYNINDDNNNTISLEDELTTYNLTTDMYNDTI